MSVSSVTTKSIIITGRIATIALWTRSGILWEGENTTTNENR